MAILASRATRPVRWRRHLRAACFWLAVALGTAAVAKDVLGPFFYVLMVPPLAFGIRELMKALGARDAGRLAERVAEKLTTALGPEYVVLTEYSPRAGTGVVPVIVVGPSGISAIEPLGEDATFGCYNDGWHRVEAQGLHKVVGLIAIVLDERDERIPVMARQALKMITDAPEKAPVTVSHGLDADIAS